MDLKSFFSPQNIAVVGVSESEEKLGTIILKNIQEGEFKGEIWAVNPKYAGAKIFNTPCVGRVHEIHKALDLVVIVVPAKYVSDVIDDCVWNKTKNVIVISAGFSEVGEFALEKEIIEKCQKNKINLLGPNCLGAVFPHAGVNASFSDGFPALGDIAFISQSGAFCTAILDWAAQKGIGFSHFISLGNKAGLSEIEFLEALADDPKVKIFALYLESLRDGKKLLDLLCKITLKKPVVILEPGKSEKAKTAMTSHTGAMTPDFQVAKSAFRSSGAIQVESMRDMFGVLELLQFAEEKKHDSRIAILTNAGGVGVMTTDLLKENNLELATVAPKTISQLQKSLPAEANLKNPIDIIGDADAQRYERALEVLLGDKNIDQILVLLTPQRTTEIEKTATLLVRYSRRTDKNIVASFVGGEQVSFGKTLLEAGKVPVFDFPSDALRVMGEVVNYKTHRACAKKPKLSRVKTLEQFFNLAKKEKTKVLSPEAVDHILFHYGFDVPRSEVFLDQKKALKFVETIFPEKVVLKIISPQALHKTEMKGVFLNIDSIDKFEHAWESLEKSIQIYGLKNAQIQVQEQIEKGVEIILGINTDPNFGKVMLFGSGGIYTEICADTALRVLPVSSFQKMIEATKISRILDGARDGKPKAIKELLKTMKKLQQLALDFPEIDSIDMNPVMVTEDRAVVVDFKVIIGKW